MMRERLPLGTRKRVSDLPVAFAGAYPLLAPETLEVRGPAREAAPRISPRMHVRGKFLFAGVEKVYLRGVTYGTFAPGPEGDGYPHALDSDFAMMQANGINAVRTYTAPPVRLLDAARRHGIRVLVGLAWEHHVAFLDDPGRDDDIEDRIRADVRRLSSHPAILGYAVGNEIPAPIVRWHRARRVERFIGRLCRATREEDPLALVTYVNYPTTEYLHLPMLDFVCFNVYLEHKTTMRPYLGHLHHIAGDRPLVMSEIGLDSRCHGAEDQALSLEWQLRTTFASGCAGAFVFAWTDEWHRGGHDVEEWDFGLVDRQRRPKPALAAVRGAFASDPFPLVRWPSISVVVCSRNGARTIRDCCEGLRALDYPDFEVIVVDDGSIDRTASIAEEYGFRVLRTKNRGLARARNLGLSFARGEIIAYLDDDARPDPHWLKYLAATFLNTPHAAVGGPNVTPPEDGPIAACVANAPGGPIHVLLSDLEAEHIPGCNMAFRKEALIEIGGFDSRFRTAGDDVDVCWRLQDGGYTLGFSPAAMVWHHRRNTVRAYWRQQQGYGEAEALLERKWPERYNAPGHLTWSGRLYSNGHRAGWHRGRVYQGVWGSAPFQSLYQPAPGLLWSLPAMPEWYLAIGCLAILTALGIAWSPLLWALPLLGVAVAAPLVQAILGGVRATFHEPDLGSGERFRRRVLTAWLHAIQPIARLRGRVRSGLTPWRRLRGYGFALPHPFTRTTWSEGWREPNAWVREIERNLRELGVIVRIGGEYDRWDLEIRVGTLGSMRLRVAVEEHGWGRQLVRLRAWPRPSGAAVILGGLFSTLAAMAAVGGSAMAAIVLFVLAVPALAGMVRDAGAALSAVKRAVRRILPPPREEPTD